MPRYKLEKEHFLQDNQRGIDPQLHAKGEIVDWEGPPSLAMTPLDADAAQRKTEYDSKRPKGRRSRSIGWTPGVEHTFLKDLTAKHDADEPPIAGMKGRGKKAATAAA